MKMVLDWLIGTSSMICLLLYLDRLRSINWFTHQPRVVTMHLCMALWLGFVAYDSLVIGEAKFYALLAIGSSAAWLRVSWETWRAGPPKHTANDSASFDGLESS